MREKNSNTGLALLALGFILGALINGLFSNTIIYFGWEAIISDPSFLGGVLGSIVAASVPVALFVIEQTRKNENDKKYNNSAFIKHIIEKERQYIRVKELSGKFKVFLEEYTINEQSPEELYNSFTHLIGHHLSTTNENISAEETAEFSMEANKILQGQLENEQLPVEIAWRYHKFISALDYYKFLLGFIKDYYNEEITNEIKDDLATSLDEIDKHVTELLNYYSEVSGEDLL